MSVDPFLGADLTDVVDRVDHGQGDVTRRLATVAFGKLGGTQRKAGTAPTTVATRGPKTGDFPLDHQHLERWVAAQKVVSRPEPGEAGTQNGDIDFSRAVERGSRGEIVTRTLEP